MEDKILTAIITCFTALVVALFGGWTYLLESLVIVMGINVPTTIKKSLELFSDSDENENEKKE